MLLPTFTINPSVYPEVEKLMDMLDKIEEPDENLESKEWLGEAYIRIVEGRLGGKVNTAAFSRMYMQYEYFDQAREIGVPILDKEEKSEGYIGVTELIAEYVSESIDEVIESMDYEYYIRSFLDVRRKIFFQQGEDVWRLIELSKQDDRRAQRKMRDIVEEYGISEMLEEIILNPECMAGIEVMVC